MKTLEDFKKLLIGEQKVRKELIEKETPHKILVNYYNTINDVIDQINNF